MNNNANCAAHSMSVEIMYRIRIRMNIKKYPVLKNEYNHE